MEITAFASPAEAHARIAYALAEVRRYLVPDNNDDIRKEQIREMELISDPQAAGGTASPSEGGAGGAGERPPPSLTPPGELRTQDVVKCTDCFKLTVFLRHTHKHNYKRIKFIQQKNERRCSSPQPSFLLLLLPPPPYNQIPLGATVEASCIDAEYFLK